MGFFSWNCKKCGHALLSDVAVNEKINAWMSNAVALQPNGTRIIGKYNGYGEIDDKTIYDDKIYPDERGAFTITKPDTVEVYHYDCWLSEGKPEYKSPSEKADNQGWFFEDETHLIPSPLKKP